MPWVGSACDARPIIEYCGLANRRRDIVVSLLHLSVSASEPERVASFLATVLGGEAMLFPPFPGCWIAFAAQDDGTAIEVYPDTHVLVAGEDHIECVERKRDTAETFVHAAIASPLSEHEIVALGQHENWTSRVCDRGPFRCVEVWIENRLLIEVLDPTMQDDYLAGMTKENWARMFGLK